MRNVRYPALFYLTIVVAAAGCLELPDENRQTREPRPGRDPALGNASRPVVQTGALTPVQQTPDLTPPPSTGQQTPPLPDAENLPRLRALHRQATDRYSAIDSYIVRLRRREQIGGRDKPEELMLLKFRKQPWSVYLKWLGKEAKGREVIYVRGHYEDKIHTLLAAGDMPLSPAGKRIAIAPDSFLARASSRHGIHETGIGVLIDSFGRLVDANERGDERLGKLKYMGTLQRQEFTTRCEAVEQTIPPGAEPQLPRGGRRLWCFESISGLPTLLITHNELGQEVEYYCYDLFQFPVRLDDHDFNPDKLWPKKN